MVFIARGIDVSGCSASPAVTATLDPHVAGDDERQREPDASPSVGEKPAGTIEQVRKPIAGAGPTPRSRVSPTAMNARIATHLDEREPVLDFTERPTCAVLMATRPPTTPTTQTHGGTRGNQNAK